MTMSSPRITKKHGDIGRDPNPTKFRTLQPFFKEHTLSRSLGMMLPYQMLVVKLI